MLNIPKLLEATKNTIELYADNPALWVAQYRLKIIGLAEVWGVDLFLSALQLCCNKGSINFFFKGDAGKWRAEYERLRKSEILEANNLVNNDLHKMYEERRNTPDENINLHKKFFEKLRMNLISKHQRGLR